jgi:hypothetical protein
MQARQRFSARSRQWLLLVTLAAACYDVGTVWMVQLGYWLWPIVAPADFQRHYHGAWALGILPVIFPVAGVALAGSFAMLRWRPAEVPPWAVRAGAALQAVAWGLTAVWWAPIQANLHYATLPDGGVNPDFTLLFNSHWLRVGLHTAYGVLLLWMAARTFLAAAPGAAAERHLRSA